MTYPPNIVHSPMEEFQGLAESFARATEKAKKHFVKVDNTVYGPFTRELMEQYVEENRVGPQTLVADQWDGPYFPASKIPEFGIWTQAIKAKRFAGRPLPTVYLIMGDIQPTALPEFLVILKQMGRCQQIAQSAWVLSTTTDIRFVRECLSRNLKEADRLFIHDSFSNSAGWFNLGDGVDETLKSMWKETSQSRKNIKSAESEL